MIKSLRNTKKMNKTNKQRHRKRNITERTARMKKKPSNFPSPSPLPQRSNKTILIQITNRFCHIFWHFPNQ